jgi:hypothetical protein
MYVHPSGKHVACHGGHQEKALCEVSTTGLDIEERTSTP